MTPTSRWIAPLVLLMALVGAVRALADGPAAGQKAPVAAGDAKNPPPGKVLVTVSKETTYITGPLRKDGYVDYAAALNERSGIGVTPENNAAVLFWKAVGPEPIEKSQREQYFKLLGIPPLPEKGNYFIPFDKYMTQLRAAVKTAGVEPSEKALDSATEFEDSGEWRPWSDNEFPILARWLAVNEKPLSILVEASKRPRRFDPLIAQDQCLIAVLLPAVHEYREIARALVTRAMVRMNDGKVDAAWDDILAVHRLARLVGQGPMLIDALVAVAIDGIACAGDQALLQHVRLSTAAAKKMLGELGNLPTMPKMVEKIDSAERFQFLDTVSLAARKGFGSFAGLTGPARKNEAQQKLDNVIAAKIDWDVILRMGNSWYDRIVDAFHKPTLGERSNAFNKIKADLHEMAASVKDWQSLILPLLANPIEAVSERIGKIFVALLLPAITAVGNIEDRAAMQFEMTKLGFALAAYHADRGSYPAKLAELSPKYVAEIPKDAFIDRDLRYKRDGDGYLLYSVGVNETDDGGKGYADCKNGESWDDIAIRVPDSAKEKPKK